MLKRILPILLVATVFLSACGSSAPTPEPVSQADIQNTAIAAAQTIVAATDLAKPTETPLPPTEVPSPTPLPTFTPDPVLFPPTSAIPTLVVPTPTAPSSDTCIKPLNVGEAGPKKRVRIENTINGTVNLSLNLWKPNDFGQCGAMSFQIKKGQKLIVEIPAGYWYAYGWVDGKDRKTTAEGSFVLGNSKPGDMLRLVIKENVIGLLGP